MRPILLAARLQNVYNLPAHNGLLPLPDAPRLHLRLLGGGAVELPGRGNVLTQPRRLGLLAYLALARPRGMHARDRLVALFWPESDQLRGRRALRNALHGIRAVIGHTVLTSAGDGLVGLVPGSLECDVLTLEADLAAGRCPDAASPPEGDLLDGFHVSGAHEFAEWLDAERRRLRALLAAAWQRAARNAHARGDRSGAVAAARRAHALDPGDEAVLGRLLEALHEAGDRVGVLQAYEHYARWCREELGTTPSSSTLTLVARARADRGADERAVVACLRGTYLWLRSVHRGDPADMHAAAALFHDAIRFDPRYAPAYAGLSNYHAAGAARGLFTPFRERFAEGIAWGERALALDPDQAIPYVHFGVQAMYLDGDWPAALASLERAVALDPAYAEAHRFLGIHHLANRRDGDALRELQEAARLEPYIPMFQNSLGDALLLLGRHEEAVEVLRRALALDPAFATARERLLRACERMGRFEDAIAERMKDPRATTAAAFASAFAQEGIAGYRREREREIREMIAAERRRLTSGVEYPADYYVPPQLRLALGHAELGEWEEAAACMEEACRPHPWRRPWFQARPELAPLFAGT